MQFGESSSVYNRAQCRDFAYKMTFLYSQNVCLPSETLLAMSHFQNVSYTRVAPLPAIVSLNFKTGKDQSINRLMFFCLH